MTPSDATPTDFFASEVVFMREKVATKISRLRAEMEESLGDLEYAQNLEKAITAL